MFRVTHTHRIDPATMQFLERFCTPINDDRLDQIKEIVENIMTEQEKFNERMRLLEEGQARQTESLNTIATAVTTEKEQADQYIAQLQEEITRLKNQAVDTTGLERIVRGFEDHNVRLGDIGTSITGIVVPPVVEPPLEAPVAAFSVNPVSGDAPLSVSFTNASTGGAPVNVVYDFGDGETSSEANPAHVFAAPGTYAVKLTVSNAAGSSEATVEVTANAVEGPPADPPADPPTGEPEPFRPFGS